MGQTVMIDDGIVVTTQTPVGYCPKTSRNAESQTLRTLTGHEAGDHYNLGDRRDR